MRKLQSLYALVLLYSFGLLGASSALGLSCNGGDAAHVMIGTALTLAAALSSSIAFGYSLAKPENKS